MQRLTDSWRWAPLMTLLMVLAGVVPGDATDTTFTDVTSSAMGSDSSGGVGWADYDGDGCVDLFIANTDDDDANSRLFKNDCDGTFTNVTNAAGINEPSGVFGVAWGDYDDDGDPDLYLASRYVDNVLYRNNGDGTFTNIAAAAGLTIPEARRAPVGETTTTMAILTSLLPLDGALKLRATARTVSIATMVTALSPMWALRSESREATAA